MATEKQCEFFKLLYDEENLRQKELKDHAKVNLTLVSFYSAFVVFAADKVGPKILPLRILFVSALVSMVTAFVISLVATRIFNFEGINDPDDVVKSELLEGEIEDSEFFESRIADYTVACRRNSEINDRAADLLKIARWVLCIGVILQAAYFAVRIWAE